MTGVAAKAWLSLLILALAMSLLLFVTAGTLRYWQAWVYLAVFFGAAVVATLDLLRRDPALLQRRIRAGPTAEERPTQRVIQLFTSLGFAGLLVVPALGRRFGWTAVPIRATVAGDLLVVVGFCLITLVYRENTFASATIQLADDQRVISSGPYAVVRHPMYASASLYLLGTPLALGSYWGFVPLAAMWPFLIWRLLDEERFLRENLAGYREYQQKVRYRLVPRIW